MRADRLIPALSIAGLAVVLTVTGCHKNNTAPGEQTQAQAQQPAGDPAAANLAAYSTGTQAGSATTNANPPAPPTDAASSSARSNGANYAPQEYSNAGEYGTNMEQPVYASEAPPPLPDYTQPEAPSDNYIWTPGYWGWGTDGYYWVPGAWVLAPYYGALWTPGYWAFAGSRYEWNSGYWGPHVGYYGGINYGHGYWGNGYEGGYWRQDHFYYNTNVTRVNPRVTRNYTYQYQVQNRYNTSRVAYNGGRGGVNFRPTREQEAARRESHRGPLAAQRQLAQEAQRNHNQYARVNHGKPAMYAEGRGFNGGRNAPARPPANLHVVPSYNHAGTNPAVERGHQQQNQGQPRLQQRPAAGREQNRAPQTRGQQRQYVQPNRQVNRGQQQRQANPARNMPHQTYQSQPRQAFRPGTNTNQQDRHPQRNQQRPAQQYTRPQQQNQQRSADRRPAQQQYRQQGQPQQQQPRPHAQRQPRQDHPHQNDQNHHNPHG